MQLLHYEHTLIHLEINNKRHQLSQHLYDSVVTTWPAVYRNILDKTPTHSILIFYPHVFWKDYNNKNMKHNTRFNWSETL